VQPTKTTVKAVVFCRLQFRRPVSYPSQYWCKVWSHNRNCISCEEI